MGATQFSLTQAGQDRLVMDWFALQDPFDQYLPIKVTNNWSGGIYLSYSLTTPPAYYANTSGALSGTLGGAVPLTAGSNDTYQIRWQVSVSGLLAVGPSVKTDTLTLVITAYASGFLSGSLGNQTITITNVLFNRYSGVIKVFGDQYNGNVPKPTLALATGGTFVSGQTMNYAISYVMSGWESDIGAPTYVQVTSGFTQINLSWTGVAGVGQYAIFRWSGTDDLTMWRDRTTNQGGFSGAMDLISMSIGTSLNDTNVIALQSGMFRHRVWDRNEANNAPSISTTKFLSPPSSWSILTATNGNFIYAHSYQLGGKNLSGTSLLGPFYTIFHRNNDNTATWDTALQSTQSSLTSGTTILDRVAYQRAVINVWNRVGFYISGGTSGVTHLQFFGPGGAPTNYVDDVFIVALS